MKGLLGVTGITDDIVIYGQNKDQCDRNFLCFLEVTREAGLQLNADRFQFNSLRYHSLAFTGEVMKLHLILRR